MGDLGRKLLAAGLLLATVLLIAPTFASAIQIHAHRGGPNVDGVASFGENSMSAFSHSAAVGFVIEMDLARTSDGVVVAMHDSTLDRTTDCTGKVADMTWVELTGCRIDRIGIGDVRQDLPPGDPGLEPVPSLAQVIELLKTTGARANIEVKNLGVANVDFPVEVYDQLSGSGLSPKQVIIQNFDDASLSEAPSHYPGIETSLLSLGIFNDALAIDAAQSVNADWVSPEWPISAEFLSRAHAAGLKVVPWTIDESDQMIEAARLGVEAVITNDPTLAEGLIGDRPAVSMRLPSPTVRARPGRKVRFSVQVRNLGDAASGPLRLKVGFPKSALVPVRPTGRELAPVAAGETTVVRQVFRVRRNVKPRRLINLRLRLDGSEAPIIKTQRIRVTGP